MFLGIMFVLSTVQVGAQAFRDEVEDSLKAFSVPPFYCKTLMTLNDTTLHDTRGVEIKALKKKNIGQKFGDFMENA